jgi:DNA-binding transcriptional MerR regulator
MTPDEQTATDSPGQYRISELAEVAGVSRDMIKYYLRAELLPRAEKPRPNLSLYTDRHLRLIELILRFQAETRLSLQAIGDIFQRTQYEPGAIELELLAGKHNMDRRDNIIPFQSDNEDRGSLPYPPTFVDQLVNAGLLAATKPLDEHAENLTGLLWAAQEQNIPLSYFQQAREKLQELADLEVKTLIAINRSGLGYDAVIENVSEADRLINRWLISEKNGLARRHFKQIIENAENALSTIHDAVYFPSEVFCKRFAIARDLELLDESVANAPDDVEILRTVSRTCLLLADFDRAMGYADALLARSPNNETAIACKALASCMTQQLDYAQDFIQKLEKADTRLPMAMEARLLSLLMQAAKLGGMSDTSELLNQAQQLFLEPVKAQSLDALDRYEAILLQARGSALFPDAINREAEAIEAVEILLGKLENDTLEELELPMEGTRMVFQIYANFCLAQLCDARGEEERAAHYYERVIRIDPASNFGEAAYLKLGG